MELHAQVNAILDEAIEIKMYTADFFKTHSPDSQSYIFFYIIKSAKSKKKKQMYPNTMIHKVPTEKS